MSVEVDLNKISKILLVRADRVGDVVVTTPVFKIVKEKFPRLHAAVLVARENVPLVEGNPYVDEVISYDKRGVESNWWGAWRFAQNLRKKKFDVAVHFHPRARINWTSYLAGIPIRIGYRHKNHWLLTHPMPHDKSEGTKHEAEYNFDLLRVLGIEAPKRLDLFVPLFESSKSKVDGILNGSARFVVFGPSASCPSKIWSAESFARVADRLTERYRVKAVIIGGQNDAKQTSRMMRQMKRQALDLTGKVDLGGLAWVLKKAELLVSNDSGPVHMAAALNTPVVSIFGRNLAGLSPVRWRPLGEQSYFIQKDVGCIECLAHRCPIGFQCLEAVSPEDVLNLIEREKLLSPS